MAASKAAVAARRARAAVKNAVIAGERSTTDVVRAGLADAASPEGTLRVRELLLCIPGLGPVRADRALESLGISPSKRVGGLGRHQQPKLIDYLESRAGRSTADDAPTTRLVVLAGPTAVGKGTVSTYIRENYPDVRLSVSATTRAPRPGEIDGVSYYFVTDDEFDRMIAEGEFLEWATVHNQSRYGTPRSPVREAMNEGKSVLLEIDIQGARQVRASMPEAVLVFLLPPTWEELVRRLIGRGTESAEEQARRLATAKVELAAQNEFDHRVVNNKVEDAAREVVDLMNIS
ncbi:guanylate kinase [Subtercola sp. YIM 133946]|uniref:guanylate kinase n=1 Tax=Subtercola sp. YIM 133946 TaxID=3118909 RepID=UPI002F930F56